MNSCVNCCPNVLKISSVTNTGGSYFLVVESSNTTTPVNGCKYVVVVPCTLMPTTTTIDQVYITLNNVNYPLTERCFGNNVYSDQLRFIPTNNCGNKVFRVVFGSLQPHFKIISNKLPKTSRTII